MPSALPVAVLSAHVAFNEIEVAAPVDDDSGHHYRDRTYFGERLEESWEFYAWLRQSMPIDARLLTLRPNADVSTSAAGVASPLSHRDYQMFLAGFTTWVYEDSVRFLHRDDLKDLGITHLHLTDALAASLEPSAARLLEDPTHLRQILDMETGSGPQHRVYQVMPNADTPKLAPSSFRALRQLVPPESALLVLGSLSHAQRLIVFSAFPDYERLHSSTPPRFERATRVPRVETSTSPPKSGVVLLGELLEPMAHGLSRDEVLWTGYGMAAYDLAAAWSSVWRIGPELAALPGAARSVCEAAVDGQVDLRLLGEPGTTVIAGTTEVALTGTPQIVHISVRDCGAFALSADTSLAPFAQVRPRYSGASAQPAAAGPPVAGLGFDGGGDADRAVINLWYRNPDRVPFVTGTGFRLYETDPSRVGLKPGHDNPRVTALHWWPGPLILQAPEQAVRLEFDGRRLQINGDPGVGSGSGLAPNRTYLLALTVSGAHPQETWEEIQHVIPVARLELSETGVEYKVFSGIVTIEHRVPGTIN